ncbi:hypothetical protein GOODEAATRI_025488 [Goodea atripinnis]|uniref:Uncharacterized protein n=1 Tax=Goodea atripinnis TaxID=208336 RepID=A0ABV0Q0Z0_9TELE
MGSSAKTLVPKCSPYTYTDRLKHLQYEAFLACDVGNRCNDLQASVMLTKSQMSLRHGARRQPFSLFIPWQMCVCVCACVCGAKHQSGHENGIHHIAGKTISLCTGWTTLYHSNSGQGNREMMGERRN